MRPLAGKRPAARRLAGTVLERGGDALALGVRVVTGRRAPVPAAIESAPGASERAHDGPSGGEAARRVAAGEEAAARLDAARERLRATIDPPSDEEGPAPPA